MKCPRCHRDTYSKKWDSCTACDQLPLGLPIASTFVTEAANSVTLTPRRRGRPPKGDVAMTPRERVAAHRARKARTDVGEPGAVP